jgi:hypothetical protein
VEKSLEKRGKYSLVNNQPKKYITLLEPILLGLESIVGMRGRD